MTGKQILLLSILLLMPFTNTHAFLHDVIDDVIDDVIGDGGGGGGGGGGIPGGPDLLGPIHELGHDISNIADDITGLGNNITGIGTQITGLGTQVTSQYTLLRNSTSVQFNQLGGSINSGFNSLGSSIDNEFNQLFSGIEGEFVSLGGTIEGEFNNVASSLTNLYNDLASIAGGIDLNAIAIAIFNEVSDENNCHNLPQKLDTAIPYLLEQSGVYNLPVAADVIDALANVRFSDLPIQGIDPSTATLDDLSTYYLKTVKPLITLARFKSPKTIPFIIGAGIAQTCAEITTFRITQRHLETELNSKIHHVLSSKGSTNIQFVLPQSNGGHLEQVEQIVSDMISQYELLGMRYPSHAMNALERGRSMYEFEDYQQAFRAYRSAYRLLANGGYDDDYDDDDD